MQILALDYGQKRIGVARCSTEAKLPQPLSVINCDGQEIRAIEKLIDQENIELIVLGWPRSLDGNETDQTKEVMKFKQKIQELGIEIENVDEAATSIKAEAELKERGKNYQKGEIDSLAAVYILEDYLKEVS